MQHANPFRDTFTVADALRYGNKLANTNAASDGDAYANGDRTRRYWHCHDIGAIHDADHRDGGGGAGDPHSGHHPAAEHGERWMAAAALSVAWPWLALGIGIGVGIGMTLAVMYGGLKR